MWLAVVMDCGHGGGGACGWNSWERDFTMKVGMVGFNFRLLHSPPSLTIRGVSFEKVFGCG